MGLGAGLREAGGYSGQGLLEQRHRGRNDQEHCGAGSGGLEEGEDKPGRGQRRAVGAGGWGISSAFPGGREVWRGAVLGKERT